MPKTTQSISQIKKRQQQTSLFERILNYAAILRSGFIISRQNMDHITSTPPFDRTPLALELSTEKIFMTLETQGVGI